jgi:GNAT superfamily N-acetyltransferase
VDNRPIRQPDETTDIDLRVAHPDEWRIVREIRLAALLDAPYAFGSTHAQAMGYAEADWRRRIERGVTFVAMRDGRAVALAGGVHSDEAEGAVDLVSMWVHPSARRQGVGEALVEAVAGWARAQGAARLRLWVTETNGPARRLYERCGFTPTGELQPLPHDPRVTEIAMDRPLG